MGKQFILGSQSPRRQQILKECGYAFKVIVSGADEVAGANVPVDLVPEDLAKQKAEHLIPAITHLDFTLLTADTVVILDGSIIGKPANMEDAAAILRRLSGRTHEVISGVCLADRGRTISFSDRTLVTFQDLTDAEIRYYLDHFEVLDKAGAYAVQEWIGLIGVSSIEGSYYNVMGLPAHKVYRELKKWGIEPR